MSEENKKVEVKEECEIGKVVYASCPFCGSEHVVCEKEGLICCDCGEEVN